MVAWEEEHGFKGDQGATASGTQLQDGIDYHVLEAGWEEVRFIGYELQEKTGESGVDVTLPWGWDEAEDEAERDEEEEAETESESVGVEHASL